MNVTTLVADTNAVGVRVAQRLIQTLGNRKYDLWFQSTRLNYHDGQLEVAVPSRFVADWIDKHYREELKQAASEEAGSDVGIALRIDQNDNNTNDNHANKEQGIVERQAHRHSELQRRREASQTQSQTKPLTRSTGNSTLRYTLDDFIVGSSNELAYTCACRLIEESDSSLNPLFIHGSCGLGKTHLLQGICRQFAQKYPDHKWRYTTAEQFTNEYITAIRTNRIDAFRQRLRRLDLLAVDDVHFMKRKKGTQAEFLHTFDAIDLHGAKLVMASDAHPKLIEEFSDALISRFVSGMVVKIDQPDLPMRARLVRTLAKRRGMILMDSVVQTLADKCKTSIREIEGTLTRLNAIALLDQNNRQPNQSIGHTLINRLFNINNTLMPNKPIDFEIILDVVCDQLHVDRQDVLSSSRHRNVVLARSTTIYLARQMTTMSYPELARALKKSNHSTIITAYQRIERQITDQKLIHLQPDLRTVTMDQLVEELRGNICETVSCAA